MYAWVRSQVYDVMRGMDAEMEMATLWEYFWTVGAFVGMEVAPLLE